MSWTLTEWGMTPASGAELSQARRYLINNKYPRPEDCSFEECPEFAPCCRMDVCPIAIKICRGF